jgi:hypothetical protein
MDVIYLIWINILSAALLFLVFGMWKRLRRQFVQPLIFDLVAYFALLKILLIFLLPAFLRIISDWQYDRVIRAMPSEIATAYTIEFVSYVVWMLSILFVTQLSWFKKISKKTNSLYRKDIFIGKGGGSNLTAHHSQSNFQQKQICTERDAKLFLAIICGLYLLLFPYTFESMFQQRTEGLLYFIRPAVMMAGPVVGLYQFSLGRKRIGNLSFILAIAVTIISLTYGLATGVRGQIIGPALWLFFLYYVTRKKYILYLSIFGFIAIVFLHSVMVQVRGTKDFRYESPFVRIQSFIYEKQHTPTGDNLLSSMEFRFGEASRLSVAFLRLYDAGMSAGWEPIKSALYAPLPRKYFLNKPEPDSVDGTKEGMGMYIIQGVMRGTPWNMSDFFTGCHAYWELGWIGVILFSFLSGLFIVFCVNYFARFGLAGLPLMMVMLKPWWNEPKLWMAQIILQIVHILIPLILIWYCIRFVLSIRRGLKRSIRGNYKIIYGINRGSRIKELP